MPCSSPLLLYSLKRMNAMILINNKTKTIRIPIHAPFEFGSFGEGLGPGTNGFAPKGKLSFPRYTYC